MKKFFQILIVAAAFTGTFASQANADKSMGEEIKEGAQDAGKNLKKAGREVKDKACEMINGKLECIGKKAANKMRNAKDEIKDKVE